MYREISSRKEELRDICKSISNSSFSHFTPVTSINLYPSEIKWIRRKCPLLKVDKTDVLDSGLILCNILKR